ncbi:MAG: 50S ribosomal protein L27, partial [Ilumatobacteraceae bacterium]
WFDLSTTEVSLLRTMLADAGPRFKTQDPSTWPEQAALLAAGRWQEFVALTGELSGGRPG